jgi:putative tricarboxylic transport membrane protein
LGKPGPGFFSFLSGLGLGLLAVVTFVKSWLAKRPDEKTSLARIPWMPLAITFGSLVGFVLFVNRLGFNWSAFLLIAILLWAVGKKAWVLSACVALSMTLGAYLFFGIFLQSPLPPGPLGILGF